MNSSSWFKVNSGVIIFVIIFHSQGSLQETSFVARFRPVKVALQKSRQMMKIFKLVIKQIDYSSKFNS